MATASETKPMGDFAKSRPIEKSRLINYLRTVHEKEDRHIKVIPNVLYKLVGSDHHAAAMLSQMLWWSGKTNNPEGWFYKTRQQWQDELFMTEWQVRKSLDLLSSLDFIETTQRKIYNVKTSHYRVLEGPLMNAIMEITEPGFEPERRNSPAPSGEILHSFTYTKGGKKGNSSAERILPPEPRTETPTEAGSVDSDTHIQLLEVGLANEGEIEEAKKSNQSSSMDSQRLITSKRNSSNRQNGAGKTKPPRQGAPSTLASVWKESVAQFSDNSLFVEPMTVADYSKLKHVEKVVAPDAEERALKGATMSDVLKEVLKRWSDFQYYVKRANGQYTAPDYPHIGFFTANAGHAVNWWLAEQEREAQWKRQEESREARRKNVPRTLEEAHEMAEQKKLRELEERMNGPIPPEHGGMATLA